MKKCLWSGVQNLENKKPKLLAWVMVGNLEKSMGKREIFWFSEGKKWTFPVIRHLIFWIKNNLKVRFWAEGGVLCISACNVRQTAETYLVTSRSKIIINFLCRRRENTLLADMGTMKQSSLQKNLLSWLSYRKKILILQSSLSEKANKSHQVF